MQNTAGAKHWREWVNSDAGCMREGWDSVVEVLPQVRLYNAGGAEPFQAEGLVGNYGFYLRERGTSATLALFDPAEPYSYSTALYAAETITEPVTRENFVQVFEELYAKLDKAGVIWELTVDVDGLTRKSVGKGLSLEEAAEDYYRVNQALHDRTFEEWVERYANVFLDPYTPAKQMYKTYQKEVIGTVVDGTPGDPEHLAMLRSIPPFNAVRIDLRS